MLLYTRNTSAHLTIVLPNTDDCDHPRTIAQEFSFFGQINGRLGRVTRNDIQHSMVVVEDIRSRKVVGFLEIGMLPKPTSSEESALAGAAITAAMVAATAPDKGEGLSPEGSDAGPSETGRNDDGSGNEDGGDTSVAFERAPDVAFLANVVVDKNQRRRGIGRTMVYSAIEVIRELWPAEKRIYVTVEQARCARAGCVCVCGRLRKSVLA